MEPLVFGLCVWLLLHISQQSPAHKDQQTRRANRSAVRGFLEDKLIEHGQALEEILKIVQKNEELTKRIIDNFSMKLSPPKMPEKLEGPTESGRRNLDGFTLHPVLLKIGVDKPYINGTRNKPSETKEVDPWCRNAVLCKLTNKDPVCGFDEKFGYGKFENICHMLYVNCYWKHNFTLVPKCNQI
ncbi:uncharacterized protein LOC106131440 [Amyelois transitella]|uniref:uncharacterized protein LOC106131440 n=1 Tax=Amyelois transitella TaxID=680683 RepID=UPI00299067BB|nr:uncharacterized protein LOC106131440 [Amyelois transitella]